jgi:hypothetical protein
MYQDEMRCEKCDDANDPAKLHAEIGAMRKQNAKNEGDAARFAYLYSGQKTGSNALVEIEMRMLSGDVPTLDEVRSAVDECMKTPNVLAQGRAAGLPAQRPSGAGG